MSPSVQKIERVFKSDPQQCAILIEELLELLAEDDWGKEDAFAIRMAVEESVMNAIMHGNEQNLNKDVRVIFELKTDRFYAKITDQGKGFNLEDVPDPTAEENLERTCGRGVRLIQTFVDKCRYNERGNVVELTKFRSD